LSNDPSVQQVSTADSIRAKSADPFARRYRVGHSIQPLDVTGTLPHETRSLAKLCFLSRSGARATTNLGQELFLGLPARHSADEASCMSIKRTQMVTSRDEADSHSAVSNRLVLTPVTAIEISDFRFFQKESGTALKVEVPPM